MANYDGLSRRILSRLSAPSGDAVGVYTVPPSETWTVEMLVDWLEIQNYPETLASAKRRLGTYHYQLSTYGRLLHPSDDVSQMPILEQQIAELTATMALIDGLHADGVIDDAAHKRLTTPYFHDVQHYQARTIRLSRWLPLDFCRIHHPRTGEVVHVAYIRRADNTRRLLLAEDGEWVEYTPQALNMPDSIECGEVYKVRPHIMRQIAGEVVYP